MGERLREGTVGADDLRLLDEFRQSFQPAVQHVLETLAMHGMNCVARPAKSTLSIIQKLKRESIRLSQMQDVAGVRVLAKTGRVPGTF